MLSRCHNPKNASWDRYGGKGVRVTARWKKFENFLADMGERPIGLPSLDRVDNTKNYSKNNCRWANWVQQNRNRSNNIKLRYRGKRWLLLELAEYVGIRWETLRMRIKRGWSIEEAVETPARRYGT